jgi:hypothetical protein
VRILCAYCAHTVLTLGTRAFDPSAEDPFGLDEDEDEDEDGDVFLEPLDEEDAVDPLGSIGLDPLLFTVIGAESDEEEGGEDGGGGFGGGGFGGGGEGGGLNGTLSLRKTRALGATKMQATWRAREDRNKVMRRLAKVNGALALPGTVPINRLCYY